MSPEKPVAIQGKHLALRFMDDRKSTVYQRVHKSSQSFTGNPNLPAKDAEAVGVVNKRYRDQNRETHQNE